MEELEIKDNRCQIVFICDEKTNDCVYRRPNNHNKSCCFYHIGVCESKIANVNRLTLSYEKLEKEIIKAKE